MQQQQNDCPLKRKPPLPHEGAAMAGVGGSITDLTVGALFLASVSTLLLIGFLLLSSGGGGGGLLWFEGDVGGVMQLRPAPSPPATTSSASGGIEPPMLQNSGEVGVAHCALPVSGRGLAGNCGATWW